MGNSDIQFVGGPCGQHGPYTFYKAFKYIKKGISRIVTLSEFFFVKMWRDSDLLCIGELQLLWLDKNSEQVLASLRLYFLPENTPEGRLDHGEDEVLAITEKVVIRVEDLITLITVDADWRWGRLAKSEQDMKKSDENTNDENVPPRKPAGLSFTINDNLLDYTDVETERKHLENDQTLQDPHVVILSFPKYCRYRAMMKRLDGVEDIYLRHKLVNVLGGFYVIHPNTRVLFCRDTFDYPELEGHELLCNHLAPKLKGRPRGRRKKRSVSPGSESNESESSINTNTKAEPKNNVQEAPEMAPRRSTRCHENNENKEFVRKLGAFMKSNRTPIGRIPSLGYKELNLHEFFIRVQKLGGYDCVTTNRLWKSIFDEMSGHQNSTSAATIIRRHYERFLLPYERHQRGEQYKPLPVSERRRLKHKRGSGSLSDAESSSDSSIPSTSRKLSVSENITDTKEIVKPEGKTSSLRSVRVKPDRQKDKQLQIEKDNVNNNNNNNEKWQLPKAQSQVADDIKNVEKLESATVKMEKSESSIVKMEKLENTTVKMEKLESTTVKMEKLESTTVKTESIMDVSAAKTESIMDVSAVKTESIMDVSAVKTESIMDVSAVKIEYDAIKTEGANSQIKLENANIPVTISVRIETNLQTETIPIKSEDFPTIKPENVSSPIKIEELEKKEIKIEMIPVKTEPAPVTVPISEVKLPIEGKENIPLIKSPEKNLEIVESPSRPKVPETTNNFIHEFKKRKLDILKEGGLEVTPVRTAQKDGRPTVIQTPPVQLIPKPSKSETMPPPTTVPLKRNHATVPQTHSTPTKKTPYSFANGPPRVVQSKSIYSYSEKTIYGNPKDILNPIGHAPKFVDSILRQPGGDPVDLSVNSPQKPIVEIMRIPQTSTTTTTTPFNRDTVTKNLYKTNSIVDGRRLGPNLEITLVGPNNKNNYPRTHEYHTRTHEYHTSTPQKRVSVDHYAPSKITKNEENGRYKTKPRQDHVKPTSSRAPQQNSKQFSNPLPTYPPYLTQLYEQASKNIPPYLPFIDPTMYYTAAMQNLYSSNGLNSAPILPMPTPEQLKLYAELMAHGRMQYPFQMPQDTSKLKKQ